MTFIRPAEPEATAGRRADSWLPSFDLHEEDGEMVVHADLDGLAGANLDIALDGDRLVLRANGGGNGAHSACLALPFVPRAFRWVSRPEHDGLEVRLRIEED